MTIERYAPEVLVLRISGTDVGEFGETPLRKLDELLAGVTQFRLFVDARDVQAASIAVSSEWAQWLIANRTRLRGVEMLTGSRFVQVTADFVRRFAELEGVMHVSTDRRAFDAVLAGAISG